MRVQYISVFFLVFLFLAPQLLPLAAQSTANPVPFINQPLVPAAANPGGAGFTLTINGTGFVSGAVASWNGSPRTTTFVSKSQVTVSIVASDIAKAGTATVTVANPGGIASQPALFDIRSASAGVGFAPTSSNGNNCANVVGDFNGDGRMDLLSCDGTVITILLGNGDGTFTATAPVSNPAGACPIELTTADLNNDGKTDLVGFTGSFCGVSGGDGSLLMVMIGNGDGTFQQPVVFSGTFTLQAVGTIIVGDLNGDGLLDLAVNFPRSLGAPISPGSIAIFLGKGDGSFQNPIVYITDSSYPSGMAAGDFNGDGKLDLVVAGFQSPATVSLLLGNGDGSFQAAQSVGVCPQGCGQALLSTADLNGDGKLDLVLVGTNNAGSVLLGNGDGTFGALQNFALSVPTGNISQPILADFNGDGKLDLALGVDYSGIALFLGNGDGTFQPNTFTFLQSGLLPLGFGDFNQDGKLDLVAQNYVLLQTTVQLSSFFLGFASQNDGTTSSAQSITLTNVASSALTINSVALKGANAGDFAIQSNSCGTSVPASATCKVAITFTPTASGARSALLEFTDVATPSSQIVTLTGTGVGTAPPAVSLSPTSLTFPAQPVSTSSSQMTVTLTNTGDLDLAVNGIVFQGANSSDFSQTNNCTPGVSGGLNCSILVTFTPGASGSRSATLEIIDNAANSPQTLAVSGTGSAPTLGLVVPSGSSSSATVQAGGPVSYTLAIGGGGMSGSASLACTGAPTGAVCTVPSTISVASATASNFTANVTTTSRTLSALRLIEKHPGSWAWAVFFLGIAIRPSARRRKRALLRFAWLIPLAVSLSACGGGGGSSTNPNGTPVGTYTLTVKATSGSTSQSVNLTLIVQ